jgi:hypothetical protein
MWLFKLADEVYELQGWEPPAQKAETIATKSRTARAASVSSNQPRNNRTDP